MGKTEINNKGGLHHVWDVDYKTMTHHDSRFDNLHTMERTAKNGRTYLVATAENTLADIEAAIDANTRLVAVVAGINKMSANSVINETKKDKERRKFQAFEWVLRDDDGNVIDETAEEKQVRLGRHMGLL